jgi:hypothetical protein
LLFFKTESSHTGPMFVVPRPNLDESDSIIVNDTVTTRL